MNMHFLWLTGLFFVSVQVWRWASRILFTSILPYPPAAAFFGA